MVTDVTSGLRSEPSAWTVGDAAPRPLPLRDEADITRNWSGDRPVVSVICATYQHVDFIEDALRGFLGQQTDFPFEILVRDDASTDGTADIVREFASRYPNIIRAVLETTNGWPTRRASAILRPMARGDYIAVCEGDDYWISVAKLQRQIDVLRGRPDAVLAHHQAIAVEEGRIVTDGALPAEFCRDLSDLELRRGGWTLTLSMVHRSVPIDVHPYADRFINGDEFLRAQLGLHGGAVFIPGDPMGVHRRHPGGIWSQRPRESALIEQANSFYWIAWHFAEKGDSTLAAWWLRKSHQVVHQSLRRSHGILPAVDFLNNVKTLLARAVGLRAYQRIARRCRSFYFALR